MNEKLDVNATLSGQLRPYRVPTLITFGDFRDVTLAGTNTGTKADNTTGRATKVNPGS